MSCFGCWLASWGRTCQLKSLKAGELKSGTLRVTEQRGFLCLVGLGRRARKQGWRGAACGPALQSGAGGGRGRGAGALPRPAPCWLTPVKCHRTGDITVPREPSPVLADPCEVSQDLRHHRAPRAQPQKWRRVLSTSRAAFELASDDRRGQVCVVLCDSHLRLPPRFCAGQERPA